MEVLSSVTIATLLIALTASMFKQSTDIWNKGREDMDVFLEARTSLDYLRADVEAVVTSKHQDLSPRPIFDQAGKDPEAHPFAKRYFVPIEFNRALGQVFDGDYRTKGGHFTDRPQNSPNATSSLPVAETKGFANAIGKAGSEKTEYHEYYDSMAMLSLSPLTRQVGTDIERGQGAGRTNSNAWNTTDEAALGDAFARNQGDVCIVGYYCAYTYDSPLPGSRATVKLHRHFRDSGNWWAGVSSGRTVDGTDSEEVAYRDFSVAGQDFDANLDRRPVQSRAHVLVYKLGNVMTPCLERGLYANKDLPYLLKPVDAFGFGGDNNSGITGGNSGGELLALEPFPSSPSPPTPDDQGPVWDANSTMVTPPLYSECYQPRERLNRSTEYFLYPDEPIAFNVVRFKATPLRRVGSKLLNAEGVNSHPDYSGYLSSNNNAGSIPEWPVALAPDMVDLELTVIDDSTAAKFETYEDWTNWANPGYRDGMLKQLVESNSRTFRTRIHVRGAEYDD